MASVDLEVYQNLKNTILRLISEQNYDIDIVKLCFLEEIESTRTLKAISSFSELIIVLEERDCLSENDVRCLKRLGSILNHSEIINHITSYEKLYLSESSFQCSCASTNELNLEEIRLTEERTAQYLTHHVLQLPHEPISCSESEMEIITRSSWHARSPKAHNWLKIPVAHVIIAHTATPFCSDRKRCVERMRNMQDFHMDERGWSDIGYNFVIGGDGCIYEGVGWTRIGIHTRGFNDKSICIAFIGNFMTRIPSREMIQAAKKLIAYGIQQGYIAKDSQIHGARDATSTSSPGDQLYEIIKKWPRFKEGPIPGYTR